MAKKKSNKHTHEVEFSTLFRQSLSELFSSKSDKALVDYASLRIINFNDLAFLNKKQLEFFVQYIGAFFITINLSVLSLLFLVDFNQFNNYPNSSNNIAMDVSSAPVKLNVLGASVEANVAPLVETISNDSCSFLINEVRYPSNSIASTDNVKEFCVNYSDDSAFVMWQADMRDGENLVLRGGCVSVEDFSNLQNATAYIIDSSNLVSGSCSLNFSK